MKRLVMLALIFVFAVPLSISVASDRESTAGSDYEFKGKKVSVDKENIYLGSPAKFQKAGVVATGRIFKEIPSYKRILREKLTRKDPEYMILMTEANEVFREALNKVFKQSGFDLIGKTGSIKIEGTEVPDITDKVIDALE